MSVPSRSPRRVLVALFLLTALALGVRLRANDYLLPHQPEPDAVIVWQAAWWDRPDGVEQMTQFAYPATFYPHLLGGLLSALPGPAYPEVQPADAPLEAHLEAAGLRYRRGRTMIAWLSVLAIPALYFVARRFLAPGWSLLAAAFLATSLLNLSYSQQARPHTASATLCLIAVLAALRLLADPSWRSYLLAALASLVTLGALHNGVFVLPAMIVAHALAPRRRWPAFSASVVIVLLALPIFYPFYLAAGIEGIFREGEIDLGGQALRSDLFSGRGYLQIVQGLYGYDPLMTGLAALGLVVGIARLAQRERHPERSTLDALAVTAVFPIAFVLVWGLWHVVPARFVNALIPYLALLAAFASREVLTRIVPERAPRRAALLVAGSLALLALPVFACARLSALRTEPDTYELAARWLAEHVDRERETIATEILLYLPLPQQRACIEAAPAWSHQAWDYYQLALLEKNEDLEGRYRIDVLLRPEFYADRLISADEIEGLLREEQPDWVVVTVPTQDGANERMRSREGVRRAYGEPVAQFYPFDPAREALSGSGYELSFAGFERVMRSVHWGAPIEIYKRGAPSLPPR